jgi:hypothetical protein
MQGEKVVNALAPDKKGFLFPVCQCDDGVHVIADFKALQCSSDGFSGNHTVAVLCGVVERQPIGGADGCCTNSGEE